MQWVVFTRGRRVLESGGEADDLVEWIEEGACEEEEDDRIALGLIGKLWTSRIPNPSAFMSTMKKCEDGQE